MKLRYDSSGTLFIEGVLTVRTVRELSDGLVGIRKDMGARNEIELNLDAVTEIDTAAAQTLLAFKRSIDGESEEFVIRDEIRSLPNYPEQEQRRYFKRGNS